MRDIIIDLQKSGTGKAQLTIVINSIFSKDLDEERVMHLKSDNKEFMTYDNVNDVVGELFKSFLPKYQNGLEAPVRGSDFTIDSVQLLSYKCHNKHLNGVGHI